MYSRITILVFVGLISFNQKANAELTTYELSELCAGKHGSFSTPADEMLGCALYVGGVMDNARFNHAGKLFCMPGDPKLIMDQLKTSLRNIFQSQPELYNTPRGSYGTQFTIKTLSLLNQGQGFSSIDS